MKIVRQLHAKDNSCSISGVHGCCVTLPYSKKVSKMDSSFQKYLTDMVVNEDDILLNWCMTGFETDENASI